ncbi:MAG: hypothetical protein HYY52_04885 [Candidatus Melainabacteria bacterium]|nr:hypothetical protein [Candidatus Melainabacteria bacterium]
MDTNQYKSTTEDSLISCLEEQAAILINMLSYGLEVPGDEIKISFPTLKNFYFVNNVYKSSWAIYTHKDKLPKLFYTGNFLIQGGQYGSRSSRSPFGAKALTSLASVANTFSYDASVFKQNWTLDLNLFEENNEKLKFSVKEYQEFLKVLNIVRAKWLLHLGEEGNFDFAICEFSEPTDPLFFMDLESIDSSATKTKTYFKQISQNSLNLFQKLSSSTEFEGRFYNLQPGMWLRDDVLIEMERFYPNKFFEDEKVKIQFEESDYNYSNPFRVQALKPSY